MKTIEEKKELIKKFEGFYVNNGFLLYENPDSNLIKWEGNNIFQRPNFISSDYNIIMGQSVQLLQQEFLDSALCVGASNAPTNNIFNSGPLLYVLKWNNKLDYYEGKLADMNDLSQVTFNYDGNMNIEWTGFELNSEENINQKAGYVANGIFYKTVSNNPTTEEIETFLFNLENCETINILFIQIQKFLIELVNLYQQGKIIQEIPPQWFSDTTVCQEQAIILNDNLLKFYVNVSPNYFQTYFKQNVDIDNILKLYN